MTAPPRDRASGTAFGFRRLTDSDLPLLHRWLNDSEVARWWEGDDVSWGAVVRDYGSGSSDSVEHWIAVIDREPIGWLQCYAIVDDPDERALLAEVGVDDSAAGIDYLIGDRDRRGRGLGAQLISQFTSQIVFARHPDWSQAYAAPSSANAASVRALRRAGFRLAGQNATDDGPVDVLVADRPTPSIAEIRVAADADDDCMQDRALPSGDDAPRERRPDTSDPAAASLLALVGEYNRCFYDRDVAALRRMYVDDGDFTYFDNDPDCDTASLDDHLEQVAAFLRSGQVVTVDTEVLASAVHGEVGYVAALVRYADRGEAPVRMSLVARRDGGVWKVWHLHYSSTPATELRVE